MNSRRLRLGAATAISVVAASLVATTTPATFAADCFTTVPTPTITGLVRAGDDLTAHPGSWDPTPTLVQVTWYVGGVPVPGDPDEGDGLYHGRVYPLGADDVGQPVKIDVVAHRTGCSTTAASEPTIAVHPADYNTGPIADPPTPGLGGDLTVGKVATVTPGTWPAGTAIEQYRWYVVGTDRLLTLATTSVPRLKLPGGTYGRRIVVRVGATLEYSSLTWSPQSAPSAAIAIGTLSGTRPTISGTRKVGRRLTAVRGTWTAGTTFSYRWYANGHAISGATGRTFTPKTRHAGKRVSVRVTGRQAGYRTLARTSALTRPIAR
jgi:hypothetical protein